MIFLVDLNGVSWLKVHKTMKILEFIIHFTNEEGCEDFMKTYRENSGIYSNTCNCFSKQYCSVEGSFLSVANAGEGLPLSRYSSEAEQSYSANLVYPNSVDACHQERFLLS
jgi:hypothetical protein